MRQPIETAPKDGRDIWVEDDRAAYDVAHWSSETQQWVWKNGGAIRITPTHWTPIPEPQYQEGEQSSSPLPVGRVRRRLTASLIAAALVVATLIGVYFRSEMVGFATRFADLLDIDDIDTVGGRESSGTGLVRAADADLREAAGGSQSSRREAAAALVQDAKAARHAVPASTAQYREALEHEALLNDTLAGELAAARSELDTTVALANKAVDEAAQLRRTAEVTTAELQKSLQQERERSGALTSELAKARIDFETAAALSSKSHDEVVQRSQGAEVAAEELRKSLQQEQARAAALASELAGKSREIETQAAQSQKAADAATKQKQAAESTIAELKQTVEREQKKTAAVMQEAKAAQATTTAAETTAPRPRRGPGPCRSTRERACGEKPRDRDPGCAVATGS